MNNDPRHPTQGYFIMGQHTSVAWFLSFEEAKRVCTYMNYRGGQHYTIDPPKLRE